MRFIHVLFLSLFLYTTAFSQTIKEDVPTKGVALVEGTDVEHQVQNKDSKSTTYFELVFLKVADENLSTFKIARQAYIGQRAKLTTSPSRLYTSFYSFPKRKAQGMFMELIEWDSEAQADSVKHQLAAIDDFQAYRQSFEVQHSFRMKTEDGAAFDMQALLNQEMAIEFAVRQIKPSKRDIYPQRRKQFLDHIISKDGYVFDREFVCIDEDLNILLFAWNSRANFKKAGKQVKRSPTVMMKLMRYFSLVRSRAFQVGQLVEEKT